jgi:hypothetical protein
LANTSEAQFRNILMVFAIALGIAGVWTFVSELARTPRIGFPANQNYSAAKGQRPRMALAAHVGLVRGDLWAELFLSFADSILGQNGRDFGAIETLNAAMPAAERALAYAPYRSDVWLLLAVMSEKYELQTPNSAAPLMMSYYTAPYNLDLIPLRLSVATRGDALRDADLRQFVEQDLQMIFAGRPELRPAVIAAYATASIEGKHLIESVVEQADPSFLASLQKQNR